MKTSSRKSKKNLLALCLSFLMVASGASAFAACDNSSDDDSSSSSSSSSVSANSNLKFQNGDFETFNTNNDLTVIGTSTTSAPGWSRKNTSSLDSLAVSGIIDLSKWDELTTSKRDVKNLTEEEAKELFKTEGALTVKDKLAYYDAWKAANDKDKSKIATLLKDFYEAFNIDSGDLPMDTTGAPLANPLTHDYDKETGSFGEGQNVLMIHNQRPEVKPGEAATKGDGLAQKYTSSTTVTVQAGTAATFSVWVKTMDLHIANTEGELQDAVNAGAFINVTHSVGSKSLPTLTIKNINTQSVTENNGWKKFTFSLKGSAYADTTFSIELGLGMGEANRAEYVNGYAFFDDVQCETVSYEKYEVLAKDAKATVDYNTDETAKIFAINNDLTKDNFAINLCEGLTPSDFLEKIADGNGNIDVKATSSKYGDKEVTSQKGNNVYAPLGEGFDSTNDVTKVFNNVAEIETAATGNAYLKAIYNSYFTGDDSNAYDFAQDEKILMLMSTDGVAYTFDAPNTFEFANYDTEYLAISFFVKTSDMTGFTGASVTLKDGVNEYTFSNIDTTNIAPIKVDLNESGEKDDDVYDGWQQYFFFVENSYEVKEKAQFTLSFNFGPTDIVSTTKSSYHEGFAAFTKFEVYSMSKAEYESVSDGTYTKVVSVTGSNEETATGNSGFDSAANVPTDALDKGFALPVNYEGVDSDNQLVNQNGTHDNRNTYQYAGLLNKDSFAKYFSDPTDSAVLLVEKLKAATNKTTAEEVWSTMFGYNFGGSAAVGSRTQPLFIWNDGTLNKGYGFVGNKVTIAANTYKKISIAVKVGALTEEAAANTFANIYLVDMDDKTYSSTLSIGRGITYWYDDSGNVCADEKCETVAFRLQPNGLYSINKDWNEYKKLSAEEKAKYEGYFANLNAYEKEKGTNNLLVADGGASHDYNGKWNNQGLDGIAFYFNSADGKYYAEKDGNTYTTEVKNLVDVTKSDTNTTAILEARYAAEADRQLMATVGNTNGEWVNVTFYIHTGAEAKNYRLEVWSGERTGKANPEDSYVAFDMNYAGDAETQFADLIAKYEENTKKFEAEEYNTDVFENVFSWYDSASYLRYNKNLDDNGYGNLYADRYTYSANEEGIAYLKYTEAGETRIFVDYAYEDVTVTPAALDDGSDDTTSSEEEEETTNETNFFMLFSSIAIAAVLVFVIITVAVRKLLKKLGKLPKKSFAPKAKKEKKEKKVKAEKTEEPKAPKAQEETDEDSPYND